MLLANLFNVFLRRVPSVLAHNQGDRLRLFDFPAPVFQFLIGVSLVLFLEKRATRGLGRRGAQLTALRRFGLLIVLGMLLDCVGIFQVWPRWGVLQTLGLGGVIVGRGLGTGRGRAAFLRRAAIVGLAGGALAAGARGAGVPFNKVLGTSSFVALAGAISALALAATALLEQARVRFSSWLLTVGSNALTTWVLQYVLIYYPAWLVFPAWRRLTLVPGVLAAVVTVGALSTLTIALARRGIRIPI